jgi:hypothetical protein
MFISPPFKISFLVVLVGAKDLFQHPPGLTFSALATNGSPAPLLASASITQTPQEPAKRRAITPCFKTMELSCLSLALNCIDTVHSAVSPIFSPNLLHDTMTMTSLSDIKQTVGNKILCCCCDLLWGTCHDPVIGLCALMLLYRLEI